MTEELNKEGEDVMNAWAEYMKKELEQRNEILKHIEELTSSKYRKTVNDCLEESESTGNLKLVDISTIIGDYQEEDWTEFDHVYVNQTIDGGYTGDEFAGYIYIPITKKLYLKSYYSM